MPLAAPVTAARRPAFAEVVLIDRGPLAESSAAQTSRYYDRLRGASRSAAELLLAAVVIVLADLLALVLELVPVRQVFLDDEPLEGREPVVVITAARVVIAARFGFFQHGTKMIRPLVDGDFAGLRQAD